MDTMVLMHFRIGSEVIVEIQQVVPIVRDQEGIQ